MYHLVIGYVRTESIISLSPNKYSRLFCVTSSTIKRIRQQLFINDKIIQMRPFLERLSWVCRKQVGKIVTNTVFLLFPVRVPNTSVKNLN